MDKLSKIITALESAQAAMEKYKMPQKTIKKVEKCINELEMIPKPIEWELGDKCWTGTYRGFKIVHYNRNVKYPYRVVIWGKTADEMIFGAEDEEDIIAQIDRFYKQQWKEIEATEGLIRYMTRLNDFIFIRTVRQHGRAYETDLEVFRLVQLTCLDSPKSGDLEMAIGDLASGLLT